MKYLKFRYYIKNIFLDIVPRGLFQKNIKRNVDVYQERIDYYNKVNERFALNNFTILKDFKRPKKLNTYYFDAIETLRYYSKSNRINYKFGDVTKVPDEPSFVKSRPIKGDNQNSILLKLNKVRHFNFVEDKICFSAKKNILIGRTQISNQQLNRVVFYEKYFNHHMCDLGAIRSKLMPAEWNTPKMSVQEHLKYKFILSLEGNDVATNLKWIMSSNSVAVSTKLNYETWFMEGTLIPDYHFICIKDDFSDLEEKLLYFINNSEKTKQIIKNANNYCEQFKDLKIEKLISHGVVRKYFKLQKPS